MPSSGEGGFGALYRVLEVFNPFADCLAPKFRPDAVEIRHLEGGSLAKVLLELQRHRRDYFDHLVSYLAEALFFTACRFRKWALLTRDRLVYSGAGQGGAPLSNQAFNKKLAAACRGGGGYHRSRSKVHHRQPLALWSMTSNWHELVNMIR